MDHCLLTLTLMPNEAVHVHPDIPPTLAQATVPPLAEQRIVQPVKFDLNSPRKLQRFRDAFAEGGAVAVRLQELHAAADAASSEEELEVVADGLEQLFMAEARAACMLVEQPPRQPGWFRRVRRPPQVVAMRRRRRRAIRQWDFGTVAVLNRALRRLAQRRRRSRKERRGVVIEAMLKEDARTFYQQYRARPLRLSNSVTATEWESHFRRLLGEGGTTAHSPSLPQPSPSMHSKPQLPPETLAILNEPFSVEEVDAAVRRSKNGRAVVGAMKPKLVKAIAPSISPVITALCNAFVRVGSMPFSVAISAITPILKHGGNPSCCADYRGIAVGTLLSKVYATILDSRMQNATEENGLRAQGQFGFRRGKNCSQAALVLTTLLQQQRQQGGRLHVCFVDFQKAYDLYLGTCYGINCE